MTITENDREKARGILDQKLRQDESRLEAYERLEAAIAAQIAAERERADRYKAALEEISNESIKDAAQARFQKRDAQAAIAGYGAIARKALE